MYLSGEMTIYTLYNIYVWLYIVLGQPLQIIQERAWIPSRSLATSSVSGRDGLGIGWLLSMDHPTYWYLDIKMVKLVHPFINDINGWTFTHHHWYKWWTTNLVHPFTEMIIHEEREPITRLCSMNQWGLRGDIPKSDGSLMFFSI